MRGANAYEALNETHEQIAAELDTASPGQPAQEPTPDPATIARSIDNAEERRIALDQELTQLREGNMGPERDIVPESPQTDAQADIDRALAHGEAEHRAELAATPEAVPLEDHVAPEQWTDRGGMVEQQASAIEWLQHSDEIRRERAAQEYGAAAHDLTSEDHELLDAARTTEAVQSQQQELAQMQVHEPSGP